MEATLALWKPHWLPIIPPTFHYDVQLFAAATVSIRDFSYWGGVCYILLSLDANMECELRMWCPGTRMRRNPIAHSGQTTPPLRQPARQPWLTFPNEVPGMFTFLPFPSAALEHIDQPLAPAAAASRGPLLPGRVLVQSSLRRPRVH